MVIPNSKIVINPNPVSADGEDGGSATWRRELYLRPGEWIPWVGVSVVATMVGLAGVVLVLHLNEKVRRGLIPEINECTNCVDVFDFAFPEGGRDGAETGFTSY